jgi:hypothetical protein
VKETGEVAYDAYGNSMHWMNSEGHVMPRWEDLPERFRDAFRACAHAAIKHGWQEAAHDLS